MTIKSIDSVQQMLMAMTGQDNRHPLIEVVDLSLSTMSDDIANKRIVSGLYSITLKTKSNTSFLYGRKQSDFTNGCLMGIKPNQAVEVYQGHNKGDLEGFSLIFHPSLLLGSQLHQDIQQYEFFGYEISEALHLSSTEQATLKQLFNKIDAELNANIDDFTVGVLVANIELILTYIKRYFHRQFITRHTDNVEVVSRFSQVVEDYFIQQKQSQGGLPQVGYVAEQLHLSANYLSDLLKKEVGVNAQDFIHKIVIDKAKHQLLATEQSVAQIAFSLGFEYPQYFSRLFKRKTGEAPSDYRRLHA